MATAEQAEALASNRIDLGLVRLPIDRRGVDMVCVMREPLMVAMPRNHPLAAGRDPTIKDIDRQPLVMYSLTDDHYFYDLLAEMLGTAEIIQSYIQYIR